MCTYPRARWVGVLARQDLEAVLCADRGGSHQEGKGQWFAKHRGNVDVDHSGQFLWGHVNKVRWELMGHTAQRSQANGTMNGSMQDIVRLSGCPARITVSFNDSLSSDIQLQKS